MNTYIFKQVNNDQVLLIEQRVFFKERTALVSRNEAQYFYDESVRLKLRSYMHTSNGVVGSSGNSVWNSLDGFGYIAYVLIFNILLVLLSFLLPKELLLVAYILQGLMFFGFIGFILVYNLLMTPNLKIKHQKIALKYSTKGYTIFGSSAFIYTLCGLLGFDFIGIAMSFIFDLQMLSLLIFMPIIYIAIYYFILYFYSHYNRIPQI